MTQESAVSRIHREHRDCCLTDSYEENHCRLNISGSIGSSLTTIHGSDYQASHNWPGRLCDRIIFGAFRGNFLCAVELKGGHSADMSVAIDQIQGGLNLADSLLQTQALEEWYPLLLYSGSMPRRERDVLQRKLVTYRGKRVRVDRMDCGSSLLDYLNRQR